MSDQKGRILPLEAEKEPRATDGSTSRRRTGSLFDDKEPKIRRGAARNQARTLIIVLGAFAVLAVALFAILGKSPSNYTVGGWQSARAATGDWVDTVELSSTVDVQDSRAITVPERAVMKQILVEEGDWVKKGQVLARVQADDLIAQLASSKIDLATKTRSIDRLVTENQFAVKQNAQTRTQLLRDLDSARKTLDLQTKLHGIGSASSDDVSKATDAVTAVQDKLDALDLQIAQTAALYDLNLANARADVAAAAQNVADLQGRIEACDVKSPIDGRIISIDPGARELGKLMSQYASLLTVGDTRKPIVQAKLPEEYSSRVKAGMPVSIIVDGATLQGKVDRVGALAKTDSSTLGTYLDLYLAPILSAGQELRVGGAASIELDLGARKDVLFLPRGPWFSAGTQDYVYKVQGSKAVKVPVSLGSTTAGKVEINSGLSAGDEVLTSGYQAFASYDSVDLAPAK